MVRRLSIFLTRHSVVVGAFALTMRVRALAQAPVALPPQAELVFEDDFEKPALDPAWKVKVGDWKGCTTQR